MSKQQAGTTLAKPAKQSERGRPPVLTAVTKADEAEITQYRAALRRYFISGEKTPESLEGHFAPVLPAPYLYGSVPDTGYPVLHEYHTQRVSHLEEVLKEAFHEAFENQDASLLYDHLPELTSGIRDAMDGKDIDRRFQDHVSLVIERLKALPTDDEDATTFRKNCDRLAQALKKRDGVLMGFSAYTPLHLLNLQLAICNARFGDFLSSLQKAIVGLQDLLHVGKEPAMSNEGKPAASQYDFADRMISFEEVEKLQPVSAKIPARRSQRIHRCLSTLKAALDYFRENGSRLFASPALASELALNEHVSEATLVKTTSSPCRKAKAYFAKEMQHYVEYIAALRMAELEINNQYDEDLHTPYFDAFSLLNISDEDLQRLPSLVVIDDSEHLMHKSEDFLQLLTESIPVAVMSVNRPGELQISGGEDGGTVFRQELAALAISHRNAYVFQGAADTPALFNTAIRDGLETSSPALWNVLIPDVQDEGEGMGFLKVNTAINARYFPRFVYNVRAGERFGGRFDINHNPQPERTFPSQILDIKTSSGTEKVSYALTTADFFALDPGQRAELEIVPEAYRGEYLIPVSAYLDMPQDHLIGKVPFIWVVSENGVLQQAALPFAWLRRCKERLDYWQFIQELGGVNSYHVHRAIEQAKKDWDAEKENALNQLRSEMEEVIERVRTEEVGLAVERLVTALLDPSSVSAAPAPKPAAQKAAQVIVTPKTGPDPVPEKKDIPAEISSEAWVESFLCTSCNDCTDALPAVFKYNSEKQAIVHNPKGATYAKIVKAAEKCPAQCIHPGLPHNPDEPGLDKLLKRAEKFN